MLNGNKKRARSNKTDSSKSKTKSKTKDKVPMKHTKWKQEDFTAKRSYCQKYENLARDDLP